MWPAGNWTLTNNELRCNLKWMTWAAMYCLPWRHRLLLWQFARREVLGRYRGSVLGLGWSFITPLLMLGVYTFVFMGVFKARWPGGTGGGTEFALQIFAGLLVFNWFADIANRAPRLVLEQPNLVKKVVFPLEILPWIALLAASFHLLLSAGVLLVATLLLNGSLAWPALALPLILASLLPLLLGLTWLLAALGVYLRDIGQVMGLAVSMMMFLSPVFYSTASLSQNMQAWMWLNPLTPVIEAVRTTVLLGQWPVWSGLMVPVVVGLGLVVLGAGFFQVTRKGFADAI